eukprot:8534044-Pyramimonas_sp.AAC.1
MFLSHSCASGILVREALFSVSWRTRRGLADATNLSVLLIQPTKVERGFSHGGTFKWSRYTRLGPPQPCGRLDQELSTGCLLYTSPSPRDRSLS